MTDPQQTPTTVPTLEEALDALAEWDALIKHQYSGSREAMSDMTYAAMRGVEILRRAGRVNA